MNQAQAIKRGDMRHRVTLLGKSTTIGDGGRKTVNYTSIAMVSAHVAPRAMDTVVRGDRVQFPVFTRFTVPYSASYLDARRIDLGSRIFQVLSVLNEGERNQTLTFEAEETTSL